MRYDEELSAKYVVDGNLQLAELKKNYAEVEVVSASISAKRSVYTLRLREDLVSEEFFAALVG